MKLNQLSPEYLQELKIRIESNYKVTKNGCWEWQLGKSHAGHGKVSVKHTAQGAHRIYYQLIKGTLPDDLVLDHFVCDNPPCINPDHLKPVTHWENTLRGSNLVAINARKTHCVNGHEFTPDNTSRRMRSGRIRKHRICRTCSRAYSHKRDLERTLEYHARGLNSKGKPLPPNWRRKYNSI